MWHLIPAILYLACVQGHQHRHPNLYSAVINNNDRAKIAPYSNYPGQTGVQAPNNYVPSRQYPDNSAFPSSYNYPAQRQPQYIEDSYFNASPYKKSGMQGSMYNNLRQSQNQLKSSLFGSEVNLLDLDDGNSDPDVDFEPPSSLEEQSYSEELELIENFGNYLKRRTQFDGSSTTLNDVTRQYNALLAVLISLARVIRNSCTDFDQIYDQVYLSTVETYYKYGLTNADKIPGMIEDYIRKGNSHIHKIKKLKQELCEKEHLCSVSVDNKIKTSPLLFVKELEALEALSHLARGYYPYIEEFNQAAQKGSVLAYLQNSKDRLRELVMHVVNSVEHVTDKTNRCP